MKTPIALLIVTAALLPAIDDAHADRGDIAITGSVGLVSPDESATEDTAERVAPGAGVEVSGETGPAFAIAGAYGITPTLGAELQLVSGSSEIGLSGPGGTATLDIDTRSLLLTAVYSTPGTIYYGGKAGLAHTTIETSSSTGSDESSGTKLALGAHLGYRFNEQLSVQADYVRPSADAQYFLVSGAYRF